MTYLLSEKNNTHGDNPTSPGPSRYVSIPLRISCCAYNRLHANKECGGVICGAKLWLSTDKDILRTLLFLIMGCERSFYVTFVWNMNGFAFSFESQRRCFGCLVQKEIFRWLVSLAVSKVLFMGKRPLIHSCYYVKFLDLPQCNTNTSLGKAKQVY